MAFFKFRIDVTYSTDAGIENKTLVGEIDSVSIQKARQEIKANIQSQLNAGIITVPEGATFIGFVALDFVEV